jgi:hypothetical protein
VSRRAEALRDVLGKVSRLRMVYQMRRHDQSFFLGPATPFPSPPPPSRKRSYVESYSCDRTSTPCPCFYRHSYPPPPYEQRHPRHPSRVFRVTPTGSLPR